MVESNHKKIFKKYRIALGIILFLFGVILRILSLLYTGIFFQIIGEIGTFIAVAVAVAFLYDIYLKDIDREILLNDLSTLFDQKLSQMNVNKDQPKFYSERRKIDQKIVFYEKATVEIIEVGAALRTLSTYFHSIAPSDFENHIIALLKKGVKIKLLLLDPKSPYATVYANYLKENNQTSDYIAKLEDSISNFKELDKRLKDQKLIGTVEVYLYNAIPCFNIVLIDKDGDNGNAYISSYIHNTSGNATPGFEFSKRGNSDMYKQYQKSVESLLTTSKKII